MTGLINRMAQRARGTLPGVEPLVRSYQTAAALTGLFEEGVVTAAPSRSTQSQRDPSASTRSASSATRIADTRRAQTPLRIEDADVEGRSTPRNREGTLDAASQPNDLQDLLTEHSRETTAAPRPQPPTLEARSIRQESEEVSEPPANVAQPSDPAPRSLEASQQHKDSYRPKDRTAIAASRQAAEIAGPLETSAEHTEIHISIGSIEVRAPQVEAPRKAAPFKPRVTLDDFLRRRSGAGS